MSRVVNDEFENLWLLGRTVKMKAEARNVAERAEKFIEEMRYLSSLDSKLSADSDL